MQGYEICLFTHRKLPLFAFFYSEARDLLQWDCIHQSHEENNFCYETHSAIHVRFVVHVHALPTSRIFLCVLLLVHSLYWRFRSFPHSFIRWFDRWCSAISLCNLSGMERSSSLKEIVYANTTFWDKGMGSLFMIAYRAWCVDPSLYLSNHWRWKRWNVAGSTISLFLESSTVCCVLSMKQEPDERVEFRQGM